MTTLPLEEILKQAKSAIESTVDLKSLEDCRVRYLGKKALLSEHLKTLGQLPVEKRPVVGQQINEMKQTIQHLIEKQADVLTQKKITAELAKESIDITLPGRSLNSGSIHPITHTCNTLRDIFTQMGFIFMEGPEIEDDNHNFTALNIPPFHPARAMQDTFYFPNGTLLRTQTSTVQIRAMKTMPLPLRMVAMGRVYRRDFDLTHTPMFHQLECLMIDETVSFANLKGVLTQFLQAFFTLKTAIRFRPSYFPFTEPSAEVDISCLNCEGKGCRICKQSGWLEILGCGMVHPNVLKGAHIDTKRYRGFAFGVGIDRLTLLKYGMSDLRTLFENDLRFLQQF
ncbi:MAG: phenylalanine--tRNA ligase subunit alpha [Gammaproteobacteria bacterium RIFCSPHIGHO2_12_FULL_37_34]|nr:MAG: phenylalanine--tRNA ligase subunit alpha [Gammaproteobacteria bacterium RIFCSPHIGHO2_12_FULL_37_34]